MTSHQDKGWGVSLPPLLFSLDLMGGEGEVIYEENHPLVRKKKRNYVSK